MKSVLTFPSSAAICTRLWLISICALGVVGSVGAQPDNERLLAGTQWFRNILYSRGLEPLNGLQDLETEPEHKILIILGQTEDLDAIPGGVEDFVKSGGS